MNASIEKKLKDCFLNKNLEMLEMLRTIVNINSQTHYKNGVEYLGQLMTEKMIGLGFNIEVIKQKEFGNQIISRKEGKGQRRILIMGHLDTVLPGGKKGFPFRIKWFLY